MAELFGWQPWQLGGLKPEEFEFGLSYFEKVQEASDG